MILNIKKLPSDFYFSDEWRSIYRDYPMRGLIAEELPNYGIYKDNGNHYYKNYTISYNGLYGSIRVELMRFNFRPSTQGALCDVDIIGQPCALDLDSIDDYDLILNTVGVEWNERYPNLTEYEKYRLISEIDNYIWQELGIHIKDASLELVIDEDGYMHLRTLSNTPLEELELARKFFEKLHDWFYDKYAPLDIDGVSVRKTYPSGTYHLYDITNTDTSVAVGTQLVRSEFSTSDVSPNALIKNTETFLNEQSDLQNYPFIKYIYGGTGADDHFAFVVIYAYKPHDNEIVVTNKETTDGYKWQEYGFSYDGYLIYHCDTDMTVTSIDRSHENTSGSTSMRNDFYHWGYAHEIGTIDNIGWGGELKPFTNTNETFYPKTGNFEEDLPQYIPDDDEPDENPQPPKYYKFDDDTPTPQTPPPRKKLKPDTDPTQEDVEEEDDPSDVIDPTPPEPTDPSLGTGYVYKLDDDKVDKLRGKLWSSSILEDLMNIWKNDPMQGIISLNDFYVDVEESTTEQDVVLGNVNLNFNANIIDKRYQSFPPYYVAIPRHFNDVRDFETKLNVYVPFCGGFHEIDISEVLGGILYLTYTIDVITGDCIATLDVAVTGETSSTGKEQVHRILGIYNGNVSVPQLLSHNDKTALYNNIANIGKGVVTGIVTGGAIGGVVGGVGSAIGGALTHNYNIERTGQLGSNLGVMSAREPFIEIIRPIPYDANARHKYSGKPTNATVRLNNVNGYTVIKDVHVDKLTCTEEEKTEVETLLKSGVIL